MKKLLQSLAVSAVLAGSLVSSAAAAGSASFSLSPASGNYNVGNTFNVTVYENGTDVNVVTAKMTYDASKLTCNGVGGSAAFPNTISASCGGGSITISRYTAPGTTVSGAQAVGSLSFTAVATGAAVVSIAPGSQIASNGTDTWNGSTAGGSYTISAATPVAGTTSGSTGGTNATAAKTTTKAAAVATGTTAGSTQSDAAATPAATSDTAVKAASVSVKKTTAQTETPVPAQSNTTAWILGGLLVIGLAILAFLRRDQIGAFASGVRNKFASKPTPKATKTAASSVASKTTAKHVSK